MLAECSSRNAGSFLVSKERGRSMKSRVKMFIGAALR